MMINISKIKLVAWDLDDTFWTGTISEGEIVPIAEHIQLVHDLTDCGIINTICSKNDHNVAERKLRELGVWDEFVFASINWDNKAFRLQALIDGMALRPANVLFLDDNHFNLQEAQHVMPALQVAEPKDAIPELIAQVATLEKKDLKHKRLAQYKVLEEKARASLSFGSSEDFLYATGIQVEMVSVSDSIDEDLLKRVHELVLRTNQLNFTKNRCSIEDLAQRITDNSYHCGYVKVHDKFGDYGIVGLFVLNKATNTLEHFLFSCRTMGQKIEQWVYAQLGFPKLTVVGEVRTQLVEGECPAWINQESIENTTSIDSQPTPSLGKILIKGPCDLSRAQQYIQQTDNIDAELTYVRDEQGQSIYAHNHSIQILDCYLPEADKQVLCSSCGFVDPKSLNSKLLSNKYDVVFLSTLLEADCGIYRHKQTGLEIPFAWAGCDITNPINWPLFTQEGCAGYKFSNEEIENFSIQYEYIGTTTPERYKTFLLNILNCLPQSTKLCLIMGATKGFHGNPKALFHAAINDIIRKMSKSQKRICYIDIDSTISSMDDYDDGNIDHYQTKIYFYLAQEMARIAGEVSGTQVAIVADQYALLDTILRKFVKHINTQTSLYRYMRTLYWRLTGRKK